MKDLFEKPNRAPIRLARSNAYWSFGVIMMYLILRFRVPEMVGKLDSVGITVGLIIGVLWSLVTLVRASILAKKGVFVDKPNLNKRWSLIWLIVEILIPFTLGYCILLATRACKLGFDFSNAVWSLIFFVLLTFFSVSSAGYYFLEWFFARKFYDIPKEKATSPRSV